MKKKLKIIDEITSRHPYYGVKMGWSEYTGGMKDSGTWYIRKMLDVPIKELKQLLANIIAEENKPQPELTEEEKIQSQKFHVIQGGIISELELNRFKKFQRETESRLLGIK